MNLIRKRRRCRHHGQEPVTGSDSVEDFLGTPSVERNPRINGNQRLGRLPSRPANYLEFICRRWWKFTDPQFFRTGANTPTFRAARVAESHRRFAAFQRSGQDGGCDADPAVIQAVEFCKILFLEQLAAQRREKALEGLSADEVEVGVVGLRETALDA